MSAQNKKQVDELCEDMEVVGPGQMLSEARKKLSLSTEEVAEKLKFKNKIVQNIEQDVFDQKLPATFNRGYLRSYAKLVNIDVKEVLSAYDLLGVAEIQRSEMQSFSNLTEKEAEHSRIMWFSYFIAAILIGLMILWWQQEPKQTVDDKSPEVQSTLTLPSTNLDENNNADLAKQESIPLVADKVAIEIETKLPLDEPIKQEVTKPVKVESSAEPLIVDNPENTSEGNEIPVLEMSTAVFTFSGDCWVNIYDATGERIAWGVKKSGYVMTITGKAPLKITLGKPELAAIVFKGQLIDMSTFNVGNIAKFTLPLSL